MSKLILRMYNAKAKRTELHTDGLSLSLGAMVLQANRDEPLKMIYTISRSISDVEAKYYSS